MTRRSVLRATASEQPLRESVGRRRTQPALVGEGRDVALDPASAAAIAAASEKAGFPDPVLPLEGALTIGVDLSNSPDLVTDPAATEPQTSAGTGDDKSNED